MINSKIQELKLMIEIQVDINEKRLDVEQVFELLKGLGNERMMRAFLKANNLEKTASDTLERK